MAAATWGFASRVKALVSARYVARATSVVPAPGPVDGIEVEAARILQESDEFQATFGVDDLAQRGVDGFPQGCCAEDIGSLASDISVDLDGCLTHR